MSSVSPTSLSSIHTSSTMSTTTASASTSSSIALTGPMAGSLAMQAQTLNLPSTIPTQNRPVEMSSSDNPLGMRAQGNAPPHPSERDIMVASWNRYASTAATPLITAFDEALAQEAAFDAVNLEGNEASIIEKYATSAIEAYDKLEWVAEAFFKRIERLATGEHERNLIYFRLKMLEIGARAIKFTSWSLSKDIKDCLFNASSDEEIFYTATNINFQGSVQAISDDTLGKLAGTPIELLDLLHLLRITNASKVIFPDQEIPLHARDGLTRLGYVYGNASEANSLEPRLKMSIPENLSILPLRDIDLILANIDSFSQNFGELETQSSNKANLKHLVEYLNSVGERAFTAIVRNLEDVKINKDIAQLILSYAFLYTAPRLAKSLQ